MPKNKFLAYWLPVYLYMGLIFFLSSQPSPPLPSFIFRFDKLSHCLEYALLGFLLIRALNNQYPRCNFITLKFTALFIAALYAASDEFHQRFVFGREASFFDWGADFIGSAIGSFITFTLFPSTE